MNRQFEILKSGLRRLCLFFFVEEFSPFIFHVATIIVTLLYFEKVLPYFYPFSDPRSIQSLITIAPYYGILLVFLFGIYAYLSGRDFLQDHFAKEEYKQTENTSGLAIRAKALICFSLSVYAISLVIVAISVTAHIVLKHIVNGLAVG